MWPDSKGKGGKEGSPKSKDGGGEATKPNAGASGSSSGAKSGGKGRNTKTKMKAIAAEGLPKQEAAEASAKLEQDIIKAAQSLSQGQSKGEETKTLIEVNRVPESAVRSAPAETATSANLMRLPETSNENIDDKISSLWKSRVLGAYRANPRASQHILPAMPNNRGALEITDKARCDAQQAAMITLVDKMFDSFQNLAFEFNNVAQASDLELTWLRPTISRENISSWHQAAQVVSVFTGRISTRRWTMVVRGTLDSVLAYVIPADKLLSFSNQPTNFQPVIELIPVADGLTVRWNTLGRVVSQEELANIYRALLDNMICIAQDEAPCDRLIDLAHYGVLLNGEASPQGFEQPPTKAMGQDINYGAKYQQEFFKEDATFAEMPAAPNASAASQIPNPFARPLGSANQGSLSGGGSSTSAADNFNSSSAGAGPGSGMGSGSSADWKPVVSTVRGANPPVPPTPMPGQAQAQSIPSTPGFNQDEPWKYGSAPLPQGQVNPSINSFGSRSGQSSQSFAGGRAGGSSGSVPGDQNDEPPLPALPAHLFEGLPPRPQNQPSAGFGQAGQSGQAGSSTQSSPSSYQGQPSPWSSASSVSNPAVSSSGAAASSTSSSDGWKSAGIPVTKAMQNMPLSPVPGYQSSAGGAFISEPAPLGNALVSPESFTSGSIRVDALAREIAHSPVSLPPAIPGFEPYSIDEPKARTVPLHQPQAYSAPAAPMPPQSRGMDPFQAGDDLDTWPETSTEDPNKPWPKARPRPLTEDPELYPEDAPPAPGMIDQAPVNQSQNPLTQPANAVNQPVMPATPPFNTVNQPVKPSPNSETNAFINFDHDLPAAAAPAEIADQDDAEIAALFEGEPVNASDLEEGKSRAGKGSPAEPAYMAWLEPEEKKQTQANAPEMVAFREEANAEEAQASAIAESSAMENEQIAAQRQEDLAFSPTFEVQIQMPLEQEETAQFSGDQGGQADSQWAEPEVDQLAEEARARELQQERQRTGEHARAAIEEGFRQAQAAIAAASQAERMAVDGRSAANATDENAASEIVAPDIPAPENAYQKEPAPQAVLTDSAPAATAPLAASIERSLKADIDRLLANLDGELEAISARGSEAFARRDLKGAERMIKLAETLSEFRDSLSRLKEEHGQDLS